MRSIRNQILFPTEVEIWGGTVKNKLRLLGRVKSGSPLEKDPDIIKVIECKLATRQPISCLKLIVKPILKLPASFPP